jgi:transposase-like protein
MYCPECRSEKEMLQSGIGCGYNIYTCQDCGERFKIGKDEEEY